MENNVNIFKPKRLASYTDEDLIEEIKRVVNEEFQGRIPNTTEFEKVSRVGKTTIYRKFGSYIKAMEKAGFTYTKPKISASRTRYTAEQVLSNLSQVLERAGGYEFSLEFYRTNGGLFKSGEAVKSILCLRWAGALEKIGAKKHAAVICVGPNSERRKIFARITKDDLLQELDHVWQENGNCPTRGEFTRISQKFNAALYERRFGSWGRAIRSLCEVKGIPIPRLNGTSLDGTSAIGQNKAESYSKVILLKELQSIKSKLPNNVLTFSAYKNAGGTFSVSTFQKHFGSWDKAVEAVGCVSGHNIKYTKDQLFNEIQRLWERFGRQPHFDEMNEEGNISGQTYHRTFGSWIKAIHAFCEDRNNSSSLIAPPEQLDLEEVVCNEVVSDEAAIQKHESIPLIITRKTGRGIPSRLRFRVLERDRFTCKACGRSPAHGDPVKLHADHILAWSNGGETVFENLQTLCMDCNLGKSDY